MKYLLGLLIFCCGFFLAKTHLGQSVIEYWDFVAFFVVAFGTIAVLVISFPSASAKMLMNDFFYKLFVRSPSLKITAKKLWDITEKKEPISKPKFIEQQLLNDGLELISLGFSKDKIQEILVNRFDQYAKKMNLLSNWLRRNAKYPPAFGLAGTVLGLIHLMRGIASGIGTQETGLRMAIALVATFYGLLISNLVLNPLGEWLVEEIKKDEVKAEMAIATVGLIIDGANQVEIQEVLNSYVDPTERIDQFRDELIQESV